MGLLTADREQVWRDAETRWTAYDGRYPVAHAATKEGAVKLARKSGSVTHVVERLRAYPFTHIRRVKP